LGSHEKVDQIEVRWTSGTTDAYRTIKADQHITLSEGKGNLE